MVTIDAVKKLFEQSKQEKMVFQPEISVKRSNDTLYISELKATKVNIVALVEVGAGGDKASIPLGMLCPKSLSAIHSRLSRH